MEIELSCCWPLSHNEKIDHTAIAAPAYREFGQGREVFVDSNKAQSRMENDPSSSKIYEILGVAPMISMTKGLAVIHHKEIAANFGPMDIQ